MSKAFEPYRPGQTVSLPHMQAATAFPAVARAMGRVRLPAALYLVATEPIHHQFPPTVLQSWLALPEAFDDDDADSSAWYHRGGTWIGERPWWQLATGALTIVLLAGAVITVLSLGGTHKDNIDNQPVSIAVKESGNLLHGDMKPGWVGQRSVHWSDAVVASDSLVAVECAKNSSESTSGCLLRAHAINDGRELWTVKDFVPGAQLISFGSSVLSFDTDDEDGAGDEPSMALVNVADGTVLRRMPDRSLVARSETTIAFREPVGDSDFDMALVGIRAGDGQEVWRQQPYEASNIDVDIDYELPPGLEQDLDPQNFEPNAYFLDTQDDDVVVRAVDTGAEVTRRPLEDHVPVGPFGEMVLLAPITETPNDTGVEVSVDYSELISYRLPNLMDPVWTATGAGVPRSCGGYVCVVTDDKGAKVLDPDTGEELMSNPDGFIWVRRQETIAVVHRCKSAEVKKDESQDAALFAMMNPCPAHLSETQVVGAADMKPIWRGGGLAFVTATEDAQAEIVLGIADVEHKEVRVLIVSPRRERPVEVGRIPWEGLISFSEYPQLAGEYAEEMKAAHMLALFNVRCVAGDGTLYCGTMVNSSKPRQWSYST